MGGLFSVMPSISVVSVALLSVFTVGYFSKIGLHFLGVVDVSNLVYSFGLTFGFVTLFATFVNGDTARWMRALAEDGSFLEFLVFGWKVAILPLFVIFMIAHVLPKHPWNPTIFAKDVFVFVVMMIAGLWLMAIIYTRYITAEVLVGAEVSGAVFLAVLLTYDGGRMQASMEVFSKKNLYNISLKTKEPQKDCPESVLKDVRIVRSSSSGFIIAIDGLISFIPKEEVMRVEAQTRITD
jgi:hypothetical protein